MNRRAALRYGAATALGLAGLSAWATSLAKVRERGALVVGIYKEMPPFHDDGKGIDVELAQALAEALKVRLSLLPFDAGEDMGDDLRNMVWKGHYLGYGPADVLMHVPVERPLMDANPQVSVFAPYYRERLALARDLEAMPKLDGMFELKGKQIAVAGQSLSGWLLIGADAGAYKATLTTTWKDGVECAKALLRGECVVAAGEVSELESVLRGKARYAIEPLPMPQAPRNGWAAGLAVKKDAGDLAEALQAAMNEITSSGRLKAIFERHNVGWRL
ncbi:ABC transporter substrate-binding protein [Pelomonas sp. KK5]|uniref:substrate-binding periplasmic protein n=1 Tax=Pelomonas sp. KK5 TaxID=1855730 RepID=UPI001E4C80B0|nr:transporter substrate-binding domain-containing protein [Pelomonas sp. KK5]